MKFLVSNTEIVMYFTFTLDSPMCSEIHITSNDYLTRTKAAKIFKARY